VAFLFSDVIGYSLSLNLPSILLSEALQMWGCG
jgi:hypothetical protein